MRLSLQRKISYFTFFGIFFLVLMDWSISGILLAPLLINPQSSMLPATTSTADRDVILGFLLAMAPFFHIFSSQILGALSDRYGRKRLLLFTTIGTAISFALNGLAITFSSLLWLFIARILSGIFAANMPITSAAIADMTTMKQRGAYLSVLTILGGASWTLGPVFAAQFSNAELVSWFNLATPFYLLAVLFLLAFVITLTLLNETLPVESYKTQPLLQSFKNMLAILHEKAIRPILLMNFLMFLGWFMFLQLFSAYLIQQFSASVAAISAVYSYFSVWFLLAAVLCNAWLMRKYLASKVIYLPFFVFGFSVFISAFVPSLHYFWLTLIFAGGCQAIAATGLLIIASKITRKELQGQVFGAMNAAMGISVAITPVIAGWLMAIKLYLPTLVGGTLIIITACYYAFYYKIYRQLETKNSFTDEQNALQ